MTARLKSDDLTAFFNAFMLMPACNWTYIGIFGIFKKAFCIAEFRRTKTSLGVSRNIMLSPF